MRSISPAVASRSVSSSSEPASSTSALANAALQRLAQRPAKQGMVIDDDEPVIRHARAERPHLKSGAGRSGRVRSPMASSPGI